MAKLHKHFPPVKIYLKSLHGNHKISFSGIIPVMTGIFFEFSITNYFL
ncbi:hypothetical protein BN439_1341 [Erwinia amylovora Ea644]|nr:hypothetical protein BN439_1341 [Erwinia amylovora Ea644]